MSRTDHLRALHRLELAILGKGRSRANDPRTHFGSLTEPIAYTRWQKGTPMAIVRYPDLPPYPEDFAPPRRVSLDEYLRLERELPATYEFHDGLMYPRFYPPGSHWAMAGGTVAHDDLIVRIITALSVHLGTRGPCKVHTSDLKLRAADNAYYPDAYVACSEIHARQTALNDATLIC